MKKGYVRFLFLAVGVAFFLLSTLFWGLEFGVAQEKEARQNTLSRPHDPVVIAGLELPAFDGVPLSELVAYQYDGAAWQPLPFQIDEVDITGTYVLSEDGLLDANDELVFMAFDAGVTVTAANWPADAEAQANPRYQLAISDPLAAGETGWVYVYRSTTLARNGQTYVNWDEPSQSMSAISYTAAFSPADFLGLSELTLNGGGVDVMDRQKIRGEATVLFLGFPVSTTAFNEESILTFFTQTLTITLPVEGAVRALGGGTGQGFAFYGSSIRFNLALPLADVDLGSGLTLHFDWLRTSMDWLDPALSGMAPATYYDANTAGGVPVDGAPDGVPTSPTTNWSQIDGNIGGVLSLADITPGSGSLANYYKDDATPDPLDTGDGVSYADTGHLITDPNGDVLVDQVVYVTNPNIGNMGATYIDWDNNPLLVDVELQLMGAAGHTLYLPLIRIP